MASCSYSSTAPVCWVDCGPLGSGSFGHVSLGLNLQDYSLFAIKSCAASSPLLPSLLNELHLLQSLRSPFIIRCLGGVNIKPSSAHAAHPPSLFLEYMDRGSLADLLRRRSGKLSDESLAAYYTKAILQGLQYLHQEGIVHSDIKSHNILLDSSGAIKIADFGAAHCAGEDSSPKTLRGTPLYMAPEVVQGEDQGPPSDIWSLGCTVVEMLQGRPPWAHVNSVAALLLKLASSQESVPLPEMVSAEAKDFLQQCLQRDPKARPTAEELLQHPFVRLCSKINPQELAEGNPKKNAMEMRSPRSTLDFPTQEAWSGSGWESGCSAASHGADRSKVPGSNYQVSKQQSSDSRNNSQEGEISCGRWITVKRTDSATISERAVQMQVHAGAASIRKASEVSFESAAFLRSRNRAKSGERQTVG